jgi:fucose permease
VKRTLEILLIYATGLIQGLVLVTVPAASSVLTNPNIFAFSDSEYGMLFVPQVITAILGALLGPKLSRKSGLKTIYQTGLVFNLSAMGLIAASQLVQDQNNLAYICFFLGTTSVGAGFGLTLPMINVYAERFFPDKSASALTGLHTLLGTGTALAPLLVTILVKKLAWWFLPLSAFILLGVIFMASLLFDLKGEKVQLSSDPFQSGESQSAFSFGFWLFVLVVFLYGYCETVFANWAIIYLSKDILLSATQAGIALAAFWGAVTAGRLLVSLLTVWIAPSWVYRVLPVMVAAAFLGISRIENQHSGIVLFGFAGLACSAFFPLSFSFAQKRFESIAETVSGALMASYMLGYGLASYGIGQVLEITDLTLGTLYRNSTLLAIVMVVLAIALTRPRQQVIQ